MWGDLPATTPLPTPSCGAQGAIQAEGRGKLHDSQSVPPPCPPHDAREWPVLEAWPWGPHLCPLRPGGGGKEERRLWCAALSPAGLWACLPWLPRVRLCLPCQVGLCGMEREVWQLRGRRTTSHNKSPGPSAGVAKCSLCPPVTPTMAACGLQLGTSHRAPPPLPVPGSRRGFPSVPHAGQRPAVSPPSRRPHPSGRPALPPRVTWPRRVAACFLFLDDCSCPTGLLLPPPSSQTPGPAATPVIFRSRSWPLPQHRKPGALAGGSDTGSGRLGVGAGARKLAAPRACWRRWRLSWTLKDLGVNRQ